MWLKLISAGNSFLQHVVNTCTIFFSLQSNQEIFKITDHRAGTILDIGGERQWKMDTVLFLQKINIKSRSEHRQWATECLIKNKFRCTNLSKRKRMKAEDHMLLWIRMDFLQEWHLSWDPKGESDLSGELKGALKFHET